MIGNKTLTTFQTVPKITTKLEWWTYIIRVYKKNILNFILVTKWKFPVELILKNWFYTIATIKSINTKWKNSSSVLKPIY